MQRFHGLVEPSGGCRRDRRAFTMVEMVVVLGILAILLAMLLPTISRAREAANRAVCASNLRQIGVACRFYASDHSNYFPGFYEIPNSAGAASNSKDNHYFAFPAVISDDNSVYTAANPNINPGSTRWQTFLQYGTTELTWYCPSAPRPIGHLAASVTPPDWGPVVWPSYMYVGGMSLKPKNIGNSYGRWADPPGFVGPTYWTSVSGYNGSGTWYSAKPAIMDTELNGATHILAADQVFFTGGPGWGWDYTQPRYVINHQNARDFARVEYQNILYGDGHVDALTSRNYTVDISTYYYTFYQSSTGANSGGFLYWGGATNPPSPAETTNPAPPPPPSTGTPAPVTTPVSTTPAPPPPPPPVLPPPLPSF